MSTNTILNGLQWADSCSPGTTQWCEVEAPDGRYHADARFPSLPGQGRGAVGRFERPLLPIFAAAILGGIGRPYGAIAGGLVIARTHMALER